MRNIFIKIKQFVDCPSYISVERLMSDKGYFYEEEQYAIEKDVESQIKALMQGYTANQVQLESISIPVTRTIYENKTFHQKLHIDDYTINNTKHLLFSFNCLADRKNMPKMPSNIGFTWKQSKITEYLYNKVISKAYYYNWCEHELYLQRKQAFECQVKHADPNNMSIEQIQLL